MTHHSNEPFPRNAGVAYSAEYFIKQQVNRSAVERRVSTLTKRRTIKGDNQAAWLLKAITMIDLTTLAGDDTTTNVHRLCQKAAHPLSRDLIKQLGIDDLPITTGAVCVYHNYISDALKSLGNAQVPVAVVSTGFPAGQTPLSIKLQEIEASVAAGATEIDMVISRALVLAGNWHDLYKEVKACRVACGESHLKVILATGELTNLADVYKASMVSMMAGADFIKTSTGKEAVNATMEVSLVMLRAIRDYFALTGFYIGYKPAGGIRKAKQAIEWMILIKEELGNTWLSPQLFRFGASGLLTDIERQLTHHATGSYSANYRHPMG